MRVELRQPGEPHAALVETVLLGQVYKLEAPITFAGGFFNRHRDVQRGEIKLVTPGKNVTGALADELPEDPDNTDKWESIIKHPFDLILRGNLKYRLPMLLAVKLAKVDKVGYIDPNTD